MMMGKIMETENLAHYDFAHDAFAECDPAGTGHWPTVSR
jgi:hypothetical protein